VLQERSIRGLYLGIKFNENIFFTVYYNLIKIRWSDFHDCGPILHLLGDLYCWSFAKDRKNPTFVILVVLRVDVFRGKCHSSSRRVGHWWADEELQGCGNTISIVWVLWWVGEIARPDVGSYLMVYASQWGWAHGLIVEKTLIGNFKLAIGVPK